MRDARTAAPSDTLATRDSGVGGRWRAADPAVY